MPSQSALIVGYYTLEPIPILNPAVADSEFERNQLLTQLEHLCNLERAPSHRPSYQQFVEPVEVVTAHVAIQQTKPLHQIVWPNIPIMGIIEQPLV